MHKLYCLQYDSSAEEWFIYPTVVELEHQQDNALKPGMFIDSCHEMNQSPKLLLLRHEKELSPSYFPRPTQNTIKPTDQQSKTYLLYLHTFIVSFCFPKRKSHAVPMIRTS
jgi:hypothetical protein